MRTRTLLRICVALACATALSVAVAQSDPTVAVTGGQIRGRALQSGAVFKGIPFAAQPVGELRWREPAPVVPWTGVRDASSFGASCVQETSTWNKQEATGNKEDCLYLNVWTPEWPAKSEKPVMLWLYGGGNTGGGASVDYFDGVSLSGKGVVLVTINYRLGLFGFFVHPGLTAESSHHASGNYGLLDQIAALKWVKDNIARFGGDPNNVTVFGQSAGSVDTSYLLASPLAKGLFQRAIQESGPPIRDMMTLAEAEQAGEKFGSSLNAPAGKDGIQFLRDLPAEQLQKASVSVRGANGPNIGPSLDGWFMPMEKSTPFR
ncbi:MAG: carboxylesterase family protein [Candidatus Solibacter sp.]|nr:carboxylesterase family protein [Candidatus Solibacter sp.]